MKSPRFSSSSRWLILPPVVLGIAAVAYALNQRTTLEPAEIVELSRTLRVIPVPEQELIPRVLGYGTARPVKVGKLPGYDLTILAIFGFISLAGIVVNDSILLVLFLKMRTREGASIIESAAQASRQRFRAIMLTSLTTIAGLLPLLLERNFQAQFLIPLAISVAFGLAASTVLVLLVVPCVYVIAADFGLIAVGQPPDAGSQATSGGPPSAG